MNDDRRRYRKIFIRLWKNPAFRHLPDGDKVMTLYLLSGPQTNRLGLFHLSFGSGVEDLGWTIAVFRKRFDRVCAVFGWVVDTAVNVVWIPSWWDFNDVRENFKVMQGALADLHEVPETPLITKFLAHVDFVPTGLHYLFENLSAKRAIPRKFSNSGIQEQEQEQKQEQEQERSSAASAELTVLTFPTVGTHGHLWGLTEAQVTVWRGLFPSLDILAEMRKALAWLQANPGRRKTAHGMPRFLAGWLTSATDSGRGTSPAVRPRAPQGIVPKSLIVPTDEPL